MNACWGKPSESAPPRARAQQVTLLAALVRGVQRAFNAKFEAARGRKRGELEGIAAKNARVREVMAEMKMDPDVVDVRARGQA